MRTWSMVEVVLTRIAEDLQQRGGIAYEERRQEERVITQKQRVCSPREAILIGIVVGGRGVCWWSLGLPIL